MNNWEYNFFRASLRLNNKPFALVTPDDVLVAIDGRDPGDGFA